MGSYAPLHALAVMAGDEAKNQAPELLASTRAMVELQVGWHGRDQRRFERGEPRLG